MNFRGKGLDFDPKMTLTHWKRPNLANFRAKIRNPPFFLPLLNSKSLLDIVRKKNHIWTKYRGLEKCVRWVWVVLHQPKAQTGTSDTLGY